MKKRLSILLAVSVIASAAYAQKSKPGTSPTKFYLDSISVVEMPTLKRDGVHHWDSDEGEGQNPDLYLGFGKSGIPFTTDTSKDPDKDIRVNVQSYPQTWSFAGKNIELKNENWRVWLYDEEGGAGEMMFGSENVNPSQLNSPFELTKNMVQGEQAGFKIKVYFSKK